MATSALVTSLTNKTKIAGRVQTELLYQISVDQTTSQNTVFFTIILYQRKLSYFFDLCGDLNDKCSLEIQVFAPLVPVGGNIWECVV